LKMLRLMVMGYYQ